MNNNNNQNEKQEVFNWDVCIQQIENGNVPINAVSPSHVDKPGTESPFTKTRLHLQSVELDEITLSNPLYETENVVTNPHVGISGAATQPTLSEPLYTCRIGWYYDATRTTSKRTGLPLKKKPSYRYASPTFWQLGRKNDSVHATVDVQLFDIMLNGNRDYVVFIPNELWSQYPNQQSWYNRDTPAGVEAAATALAEIATRNYAKYDPNAGDPLPIPEIEIGNITVDLNSLPKLSATQSTIARALYKINTFKNELERKELIDNSSVNNSHVGNTGFWKRFLNWFKS